MTKVELVGLVKNFRRLDLASKTIFYLSLFLFVVLVRALVLRFMVQGDTAALIGGSNSLYECWFQQKTLLCPGVDPFPILQRLIVLPTLVFTKDQHVIGRVLSLFSFVSFCGLVVLAAVNFFHRKKVFFAFFLTLITSPLLYYSRATFGEMLATFSICLFAYGCIQKKPAAFLFVTFTFAAFSKEITFPFLGLIYLTTYFSWFSYGSLKDFWQELLATKWVSVSILLACAFSVGLTVGHNFIRYNQYYNVAYTVDAYQFESIKTFTSFFLGLWFAPNSGVMFFWNSAFIIFFVVFLIAVRDRKLNFYSIIPAAGVLMLNLISTAGLAKWWAPFGWIAWGPRLSLPFVAVGVFISLHFYGEKIIERIRLLKTGRVLLLVVFLVLGVSQFMVLKNTEHFASLITDPILPECPKIAIIEESKEYYYKCMDIRMWRPRYIVLLETFTRGFSLEKAIGGVSFAALVYLISVNLFSRKSHSQA